MEPSLEKNPWSVQGLACQSWWAGNTEAVLTMSSRFGELDIPVDIYFRDEEDMPDLETYALAKCTGRILEVGAGTGSHALVLQELGHQVTAIDIDPTLVQIMRERGVKDAREADIFTFQETEYDTILMLMNGIGVAGTLSRLPYLLDQCRKLLTPEGKLIFDTSDLFLSLEENSDNNDSHTYFGEVWYKLAFRERESAAFPWLFLDHDTLQQYFTNSGWKAFVIYSEDESHYLVMAQPL